MSIKETTYLGGSVASYDVKKGRVWVIVTQGKDGHELRVYEESVALLAHKLGISDDDLRRLGVVTRSKNRFGFSTIRQILRMVRSRFPDVRKWAFERKGGANYGRRRVMVVR